MKFTFTWSLIALLASTAVAHTEEDIKLEIEDLSLPELAKLDLLHPPSEYHDRVLYTERMY